MVCEKLGVLANAPKESRLQLVHASQAKKIKAGHGCDATLLKRGTPRV
jgi:hypothetical protein